MSRNVHNWTNKSVKLFAQQQDPVRRILKVARNVAMEAIDRGWTGPPFDPIDLATRRGIDTIPSDQVRDARLVPTGRTFRIEYNPNRAPARVRYTIAHEIAHTLFPDCADEVRHRDEIGRGKKDEWQLEALCNIAASELLIPAGSLPRLSSESLNLSTLLALRSRYAVSTEAMFIRIVELSYYKCAMFCASRFRGASDPAAFQVDYLISSGSWKLPALTRWKLPTGSIVTRPSQIGHSWTGHEKWSACEDEFSVSVVAVSPYPGTRFPRIVGFVVPATGAQPSGGGIRYVYGDATEPNDPGKSLIVQIVNDATPNWGGKGFAVAMRQSWPDSQRQFREWSETHNLRASFGRVHFAPLQRDKIVLASMICQKGYGESKRPRLRYEALANCLSEVADYAKDSSFSVHMPRIGTGAAGGRWDIVEDLIRSSLVSEGIPVTVYDLPGSVPVQDKQMVLDVFSR